MTRWGNTRGRQEKRRRNLWKPHLSFPLLLLLLLSGEVWPHGIGHDQRQERVRRTHHVNLLGREIEDQSGQKKKKQTRPHRKRRRGVTARVDIRLGDSTRPTRQRKERVCPHKCRSANEGNHKLGLGSMPITTKKRHPWLDNSGEKHGCREDTSERNRNQSSADTLPRALCSRKDYHTKKFHQICPLCTLRLPHSMLEYAPSQTEFIQ